MTNFFIPILIDRYQTRVKKCTMQRMKQRSEYNKINYNTRDTSSHGSKTNPVKKMTKTDKLIVCR